MMSAESNSKQSVSYQKKDGRSHAHPSFFWYDNDKDLKVYFLVTCVRCPDRQNPMHIRPLKIGIDKLGTDNLKNIEGTYRE